MRERGERGKDFEFVGHRGVELEEEVGDLGIGPAVSCDHVHHLEQRGGQGVAGRLVTGEGVSFVRTVDDDGDDSAGEQVRVTRLRGPGPPRPMRRREALAYTHAWPSLVGTTPDAASGRKFHS
jgi:hypothetical protein